MKERLHPPPGCRGHVARSDNKMQANQTRDLLRLLHLLHFSASSATVADAKLVQAPAQGIRVHPQQFRRPAGTVDLSLGMFEDRIDVCGHCLF